MNTDSNQIVRTITTMVLPENFNSEVPVDETDKKILIHEDLYIIYLNILDRSRSMTPYQSIVINAYNAMIESLKNNIRNQNQDPELIKKIMERTLISLYTFDTECIRIYRNVPLEKVKPLTPKYYQPEVGGSTGLYASVKRRLGRLIQCIRKELGTNNIAVLGDVYTDGEDNESSENDIVSACRYLEVIRKCKPGPHDFQITGLGPTTNPRRAMELLGFDRFRQIEFTAKAMQETMTRTGEQRGDQITSSFIYEQTDTQQF